MNVKNLAKISLFSILLLTTLKADWNSCPTSPTKDTITFLKFVDSVNGYLGTSTQLYKTVDGGHKWKEITVLSGFYNYYNIPEKDFIQRNLQSSAYSKYLVSSNNGKSWVADGSCMDVSKLWSLYNSNLSERFNYLHFMVNRNCGYDIYNSYDVPPIGKIKKFQKMTKTNIGFDTTVLAYPPLTDSEQYPIVDMVFSDTLNGWISGYNYDSAGKHTSPIIIKTSDGGKTWDNFLLLSDKEKCFNSIKNKNQYCFWTSLNNIYASFDSLHKCKSLADLSALSDGDNYSITCAAVQDDNSLWVALQTTLCSKLCLFDTAGIIQFSFVAPTKDSIKNIFFANDSIGWASGNLGLILKYSMNKDSQNVFKNCLWTQSNSPTKSSISFLKYFDSQNGYVGTNYQLFSTKDGGITWDTIIQNGDTGVFRRASYENIVIPQKGTLILRYRSSGGYLFKRIISTDDGITWSTLETETEAFTFLDSQIGWKWNPNQIMAGTYSNKIYKTMNGGSLWDTIPCPFQESIQKLFFIDSTNGWASGTNTDHAGMWHLPSIAKTTDGGITWQTINGFSKDVSINKVLWAITSKDLYCFAGFPYPSYYSTNLYLQFSTTDAKWLPNTLDTTNGGILEMTAAAMYDNNSIWVAVKNRAGSKLCLINSEGVLQAAKDIPDSDQINQIYFTTPTFGWAAGSNGLLLQYIPSETQIHKYRSAKIAPIVNRIEYYDLLGRKLVTAKTICKNRVVLKRILFKDGHYKITTLLNDK